MSTASKSGSKSGAKRGRAAKIGKYTLALPIGKGGYGEVFVGVQRSGRRVAIKLLDASHCRDEDAVLRFKREAETARRLEHPNIVRLIDVGSSRNRHYIIMELVRGGSLKALMSRAPELARARTVLAVLVETARALAYAHECGIVHRDVKPANILVTRSGKAKVADFGLARAIDQSSMTTHGKVLGTAAYMSPEQARGLRATNASDVYSMGIILYEVATGAAPFQSDNQLGFLYQHAEVEPPAPAVRTPYPPALGELALACMQKDSADRPAMTHVADRLAAISLRPPRRYLRLAILLALLVVAIAVLLIVR